MTTLPAMRGLLAGTTFIDKEGMDEMKHLPKCRTYSLLPLVINRFLIVHVYVAKSVAAREAFGGRES